MTIDLWPGIPEEHQVVLAEMGLCLSFVQGAESILSKSLGLAFHAAPTITVESLEAEERMVRRKTLGQLLSELRKRVDIAPGFDAVLASFLDDRNLFIHGMRQRPEFDLDDAAGRRRLLAFLNRLDAEACEVMRVLMAAVAEFIVAVEASRGGEPFCALSDPQRRLIEEFRAMTPELSGTFTRKP